MSDKMKTFVSRVTKLYTEIIDSERFKTLKKYLRYIIAFLIFWLLKRRIYDKMIPISELLKTM